MSEREDWIAEAILDAEDEAAWRAQRDEDLGHDRRWCSAEEMIARWAAERAEVESQYIAADFDGYEI